MSIFLVFAIYVLNFSNFNVSGNIEIIENFECSLIDDYISKIDKNIKNYTLCKNNIFGLSTEGAQLLTYYDDSSLVKMSMTYFGETGNSEDDIYYMGDNVSFVRSIKTFYDKPFYIDDYEIESQSLDMFYFQNDSLFVWLNDNTKINNESEVFQNESKKWKNTIQELENRKTRDDCDSSAGRGVMKSTSSSPLENEKNN